MGKKIINKKLIFNFHSKNFSSKKKILIEQKNKNISIKILIVKYVLNVRHTNAYRMAIFLSDIKCLQKNKRSTIFINNKEENESFKTIVLFI